MAQGTLALFDEFAESIGDGRIDLDTDTFKIAFVTLQVGGTPTIAKTDASVTWGQTAGVSTFDAANNVWTSAASGDPATIKTAVIYSDTAANKDCIGFIDMTVDGTTAISLLSGDITVSYGATGIFTVTNP